MSFSCNWSLFLSLLPLYKQKSSILTTFPQDGNNPQLFGSHRMITLKTSTAFNSVSRDEMAGEVFGIQHGLDPWIYGLPAQVGGEEGPKVSPFT